ncbi:hypothetical protein WE348_08920 [Alteromonas macleodii]|uniref:hypothetical protein n=1 Tax=Alteromonas macleodii TaxID=28108 RepID=UPI000C8EC3CD|nr:hypothetical protein [Idiomarinaceae bacterium]
MLYLKSASLGLVCTLVGYGVVTLVDLNFPASIMGININFKAFLIKLAENALNLTPKDASLLTWIILTTLGTYFVAAMWALFDNIWLWLKGKFNKGINAKIILMGRVLSDSPLDALLYQSYISEKLLVMLTLSNRKVYVGVVNNMGEPNEVEGFDQEISLVPILSGYRDKDDLSVHWTTSYQEVDPDENLRIVIRQELIESASEFDFDTWEAFASSRKAKDKKIKVTFNPHRNSFSWTLS